MTTISRSYPFDSILSQFAIPQDSQRDLRAGSGNEASAIGYSMGPWDLPTPPSHQNPTWETDRDVSKRDASRRQEDKKQPP